MRNTTLSIVLMAFFCIFVTSCSKEDEKEVVEPDVTLSMSNISMYYDQTKKLTSPNATVWKSENDFVAKVDETGLVTGCHVGTTRIVASNGKSSAVCNVTIIPKNNLYDAPLLDWGASMTEVKNKETHHFERSVTSTSLTYNYFDNSDNPCLVNYVFEDNKLRYVFVYLKWNYFSLAVDHIMERYQPMSVDRVNQYAMFWDAYTADKLKTVVYIEPTKISESQVVQVSYADALSLLPSETTEPSSLRRNMVFTWEH